MGSVRLNTAIWNNLTVIQMTGLTIEMLSKPLHTLALFIKTNLVPNDLEYFDLDSIQKVKNIQPKLRGSQ